MTRPQIIIGGWQNAGNAWTAASNAADGSSGSGRTFLMPGNLQRVRQHGFIDRVEFKTSTSTTTGFTCNLVVYRQTNGTGDASKVATSEDIVASGASATIAANIAPIAVQPGDIVGMYIQDTPGIADGFAYTNTEPEAGTLAYYVGSPADNSSQEGVFSPGLLAMRVYGKAPKFAFTGDSIVEGHNNGTIDSPNRYHGFLHTDKTFGGLATSEPAYHIRNQLGNGWTYQNHALGGSKIDWVRASGVPSALTCSPEILWISVGINDIINDTTTASEFEGELDTIRDLVSESIRLVFSEILPSDDADDSEAAKVREFNLLLKTWCAANRAELIGTNNALSALRASTGRYDNLSPSYNFDGTHLTTAGVTKLASLVANGLSGGNLIEQKIGNAAENWEADYGDAESATQTAERKLGMPVEKWRD